MSASVEKKAHWRLLLEESLEVAVGGVWGLDSWTFLFDAVFAVWRAVAFGERSNKKFTFVILFISVNASLCKLAQLFFWRVTKNKFRVK